MAYELNINLFPSNLRRPTLLVLAYNVNRSPISKKADKQEGNLLPQVTFS